MKRVEVYVSVDFVDRRLGTLEYDEIRGREASSFSLDDGFLREPFANYLGPDVGFFKGRQYPVLSAGFGLFQDAAPDSWGRRLIRRRERRGDLRESDYLLGVFDMVRMGALRFKVEGSNGFTNSDGENPAPPWTTLRTLEDSSLRFEADDSDDSALSVLLRPGTSLGGARPKASVTAPDGSLWMAKFPSRDDEFDTGAWEYLVHTLAGDAGIRVPEAQCRRFSKYGSTFLCRRFDRDGQCRIPFASAMTMLGCEDMQESENGTYFDLAGFIMQHGSSPESDLKELWRRMLFSFMVTNTDDHLRNHGFLLESGRWRLSPAYDLNANIKRRGPLSLDLDAGMPIDSVDVLVDAAEYFRIGAAEAQVVLREVQRVVHGWRAKAERIGIPRREQELFAPCFRV